MSGANLRLSDAARSDVGKVRAVNEDSFVALAQHGLWAVADGMGGHANGQRASRAVIESLLELQLTGDFESDAIRVADSLHAANAKVHAEAGSIGKQMGSTAVALLVEGRRFAVVWAGDSRVYLLRHGMLHQLTRDHTQVQEMVDRGLLAAEDAANHPMKHVISRAVGVQPLLEVDGIADEARAGDVFLLCSDGLYGVVSNPEIAQHLAVGPPGAACDRLLTLSLDRGAPDNVTLIAVACEESTTPVLASPDLVR